MLLIALLAGCLDQEEDDCNANALAIDAQSADPIPAQWWIGPVAVGGSQHIYARTYDECGTQQSPSQITVSSNVPAVVDATVVATEEIEVRAHEIGTATLSISNARGLRLADPVEAKLISSVVLASTEEGDAQAFYPAKVAYIQLLDADAKPLVDRGLTVVGDVPRSSVWDELDLSSATPGDHSLEVTAGISTWPVTLTVVDGIDSVVAEHAALTSSAYESTQVCFLAERGGKVVAGVPWTFTVDSGNHDEPYIPNCIDVWGAAGTTVTVTGSALGLSAVASVTFTNG
jgi:hypothetical protein